MSILGPAESFEMMNRPNPTRPGSARPDPARPNPARPDRNDV